MNINRNLRFCGLFALALLAVAIVPSVASAQAFRGKFTLPFTAHWGGLALPAGEYYFSADNLTDLSLITIQHDGHYVGSVMVGGVAYDTPYNQNELVAVPIGQIYRISVLRLGHECAITFPIPKREREQMSAAIQFPVLARVVAVQPDKA